MSFDVYLRKASEYGKAIFPTKFCLRDDDVGVEKAKGHDVRSLESLKREKDIWEFSGQYLNDPVDEDAVEFKRSWFNEFVMDESLSRRLEKGRTILSVDPAFRLKQTNDFSGLVVTKTSTDNLVYVFEAQKIKVNAKDLVDRIFVLAQRYQPDKVLVETVSAQVLLLELLKQEMRKRDVFFTIEEVKPSTTETKAARIRGLVPQYANGRIFHSHGLKDLEAELIEFPRGVHDDVIDALSYQIPFWKGGGTSKAKQEDPYWSLNWFKKQRPKTTVIGGMFRDLVPQRHR